MGDYGLFFELLQVAIGNRKNLSRMPSATEWTLLFDMSKKQALVAIAFAGVNRLKGDGDFGSSLGMPETLYLKWLGLTAKVQQRNREVTEACAELVCQLAHDGLKSCILKGQSNLVNYPEDLQECRTAGDIDIWVQPLEESELEFAVSDLDGKGAHHERYTGNRAVIEYALMQWRVEGVNEMSDIRFHHIDYPKVGGVDVEMHFRPMFCDSPLRCYRFLKWCREHEQFGMNDALINGCVLPVPTASFNAVYQLMHIQRHLFDEGIGLRQLLDYYFVLRGLHVEQGEFSDRTQSMALWAEGMGISVKSNVEIMHILSRFGMAKFASATMYVLQTVFALPDEYLICQPNEKEGKFLLNEIMLAGNFGKYDERIKKTKTQGGHAWEKLKHNLRLVRHYPEEVMWEPFFRVYHWVWRKCELWRF